MDWAALVSSKAPEAQESLTCEYSFLFPLLPARNDSSGEERNKKAVLGGWRKLKPEKNGGDG